MASDEIKSVPAPWKLKGTIYTLLFWASKSQADPLPAVAYSPLEASSSFASGDASGRPLGGLSMIQIIRYSESPVGPYDELVICPGYHEYVVDGEDGRRLTKKNVRVTRVYVSQKHTCWNGRKSKPFRYFLQSDFLHPQSQRLSETTQSGTSPNI